MTDKFELAATAVAKGLVETIPGGSVITNLISALTTGNDEAFQQQLHQEALDATLELKRRIDLIEEQLKKQGKELEELGALRTRKCFADFAAAYAETTGDGKREALLNVAARQFDSSLQTLDLRAFWFSVVRSLSDYEIVVLRELARRTRIAVVHPHIAYAGTQKKTELESDSDVAAAFIAVLQRLEERNLVSKNAPFMATLKIGTHEFPRPVYYSMNAQGEALVRAMAPVEPEDPAPGSPEARPSKQQTSNA